MYRERLNATILKLFGQRRDDEMVAVPAQSGLHRHGNVDRLHHRPRDVEHEGHVLQHAGAGSLARHLLHGTAEIQVDDVGPCLFHTLGGLHHVLHRATIDLYPHGAFLVADGQFVDRGLDVAHQGLGRHELGVDHGRAETLAEHAESDVGDVLHGGQQQGAVAQINLSYLHTNRKVTYFLGTFSAFGRYTFCPMSNKWWPSASVVAYI